MKLLSRMYCMIEVFKTNVDEANEARKMIGLLKEHFPASRINIDLHDCDKVLRLEGQDFQPGQVITLMTENGYNCSILE